MRSNSRGDDDRLVDDELRGDGRDISSAASSEFSMERMLKGLGSAATVRVIFRGRRPGILDDLKPPPPGLPGDAGGLPRRFVELPTRRAAAFFAAANGAPSFNWWMVECDPVSALLE